MDPLLKELTKLEKLTATSSKGLSIAQSLDSLLHLLHQAREKFVRGECSEDNIRQLVQMVESKKKDVDERQKEVYSVLSRLGKALDKVSLLFPIITQLANSISRNLLPHFQHILNYSLFRPP